MLLQLQHPMRAYLRITRNVQAYKNNAVTKANVLQAASLNAHLPRKCCLVKPLAYGKNTRPIQ